MLCASLRRVAALLASGQLAPLPRVAFSLTTAASALRHLAQAQHVGKVVVQLPTPAGPAAAGNSGSWVISGGLGALGSLAAGWLASQGCRHLVLLGRSGRSSQQAAVLPCTSAAEVVMQRCDASTAADTAGLAAAAEHPPAAGVLHSGGVLHYAGLTAQSAASMRAVHAPKLAAGAAMLHSLGSQPLHQLLLFSSAASLFGAPGQASYTAANAALEGWAAAADAGGLNTVAVQWGAWAAGEPHVSG